MEENNLLKRKNNACNGGLRKKSKKMNLTKENKIKWKEMSFEEWYDTDIQVFYIWYFIGENKFGVWEGVDQLTQDEEDHFNKFIDQKALTLHRDFLLGIGRI